MLVERRRGKLIRGCSDSEKGRECEIRTEGVIGASTDRPSFNAGHTNPDLPDQPPSCPLTVGGSEGRGTCMPRQPRVAGGTRTVHKGTAGGGGTQQGPSTTDSCANLLSATFACFSHHPLLFQP